MNPHNNGARLPHKSHVDVFALGHSVNYPELHTAQQQYDPYSDRLYRKYLWATIVGVAGGFIGIGVLSWQTSVTRIAANAAKASADAIRNSERAWILINIEQPIVGEYRFYFKVHGNTPAKVTLRDICRIIISSLDDLAPFPSYDFSNSPKGNVWAAGEEKSIRRGFSPLNDLMPEPWGSISRGEKLLVVYGVVNYLDVINESTPHETRFCYVFDPLRMEFILDGPKEYNQYT